MSVSSKHEYPRQCDFCGGPIARESERTLKLPPYVWSLLLKDLSSTRRYEPIKQAMDQKTIAVHGPNKTYYFELDDER